MGDATLRARLLGVQVQNSISSPTSLMIETGGRLEVFSGAIVSGQSSLDIIASDLWLYGDLESLNGNITITQSDGQPIGLGGGALTPAASAIICDGLFCPMFITNDELSRIDAISSLGEVIFGKGDIFVDGVSYTNSFVRLRAENDEASISFDGLPSSFLGLIVEADNGIDINTHLTTTSGMFFVGDFDSFQGGGAPWTVDGNDGIRIADGIILSSEDNMLFSSFWGGTVAQGDVGLNAKSITISHSPNTPTNYLSSGGSVGSMLICFLMAG